MAIWFGRGRLIVATILVGLAIGLGGMLITALFTPRKPDTYGSRLTDINVQAVSVGNPVTVVWGTMKVTAQLIMASPLIETMHTHQTKPKGGFIGSIKNHWFGAQPKEYTYTYSIDGCWGICAGPVYQINRIWANQKLLYVNPSVAANSAIDFYNAYQAQATYLIDVGGLALDAAAASAYVFAYNNYNTAEITLTSPSDAINYILANPIIDESQGTLYPDSAGVTQYLMAMYSGLNNTEIYMSQINRYDMIEIYQGDELQAPNGLYQGYVGIGNAPAFRGCAYFVLTNLQLMDFGNSVPSFTVEVQMNAAGTTNLPEILSSVCYQEGLEQPQFDAVSNVDPTPFPGFCVTQVTTGRQVLMDLQKVFAFDSAETGYKIVFSMVNSRPDAIIQRGDFGAHADTEPLPVRAQVTRVSDYDLPQRINLHFQEPARNFSTDFLYAARYNTPCLSVENIEVTVALDRDAGQKSVSTTLQNRMFARRVYAIQLPRKYVQVEPTDVVKVQNRYDPSFYDEYYCTEIQIGANGLIKAQFIDHFYMDPAIDPSSQVSTDLPGVSTSTTSNLPQTSSTLSYMFDCPLLQDGDPDTPGFYVILCGAMNAWQGGAIYVDDAAPQVATAYGLTITTPSSGAAWGVIAQSRFNVPHGVAVSTLAKNMQPCYWDDVSVLLVQIGNKMGMASATRADLLTQPLNVAFVGQELIQFANAENLTGSMWRLTGIMRGLRGTERFMNNHVIGEDFVYVAAGSLQRIQTTQAELNQVDTFHNVSFSSTTGPQVSFKWTDTGNSLRPLEVKINSKFRAVSDGAITIKWWPRVRQSGEWIDGYDVSLPANDTPEEYSIDVLAANRSTVVATYAISGSNLSGTWTYTAAQQTTDFGSVQDPINIVIYQISQVIGRGFPLGITF